MLVIFLGAIGGFIFQGIVGLFVGAVVLAVGYNLFNAWLAEEEFAPDAGAPLEAIHLCEAALAAAPEHEAALQASIDAHERLERESVNFWETSWLRKQLSALREKLP